MSLPPVPVPERTKHPFLTYDMIREIPAAISVTISDNGERMAAAGKALAGRRDIFFTGCGTAFYAAMLGEEFMRPSRESGVRSTSVPALELQTYDWGLSASSGVIGVSHSGITKTTVDAMKRARLLGARTVGITHFADRPIAAASDDLFVVGGSPDRSRMHTKCYVDSAIAAALISIESSAKSSEADKARDALRSLPRLSSKVIAACDVRGRELAEKYAGKRRFFFTGTGPNVVTALETALKFKETSYLGAEGLETEQMIHGPWMALDEETHITIISPTASGHQRAIDLARCAKAVGAPSLCIVKEGEKELSVFCDETVEIPEVEERLTPYLAILPLYFFAYYSSVARGNNPDLLRYLHPKYWRGRDIVFPPGTH
jgi:glutamine---fructose-6-phosphate transaminase (isomerizing)